MIDVTEVIHPLTAFKRQTAKFARLLKKSHRLLVLTVEGKARFVVFDTGAYGEWKDWIETIEAVNEALAEGPATKFPKGTQCLLTQTFNPYKFQWGCFLPRKHCGFSHCWIVEQFHNPSASK